MKKKVWLFLICLLLVILGGDIYLYFQSNQLFKRNLELERGIKEYGDIVQKVDDYEELLSSGTDILNLHKELEEKKDNLLKEKEELEREIERLEKEIQDL